MSVCYLEGHCLIQRGPFKNVELPNTVLSTVLYVCLHFVDLTVHRIYCLPFGNSSVDQFKNSFKFFAVVLNSVH